MACGWCVLAVTVQTYFELRKTVLELIEVSLDLLFPPLCGSCKKEGSWLCQACLSSLVRYPNSHCPFCKKPSFRGFLCLWCREKHAVSQILASCAYDDRVRRMIHAIKFGHASSCIALLVPLLVDVWEMFGDERQRFVIPIPLHGRRLRERGFNQAGILARQFSNAMNMQYLPDVLTRIRPTDAQAELSREKRLENVAGVFVCRRPIDVLSAPILLIDDVFTTGATLTEAARVLRAAGAQDISALTFAHG